MHKSCCCSSFALFHRRVNRTSPAGDREDRGVEVLKFQSSFRDLWTRKLEMRGDPCQELIFLTAMTSE